MVLIVGSTLVAVAVAIAGVVWWTRPVAVAAFAVSVLVTAVYRGPGNNEVAAWLLVDTVGQLVVLAQVTRRTPALAPLGVVAVGVSPLRIGLWLTPPSPAIEVVGVCAVWTVVAAAAVGVGAYLRSLDRARARAVVTARAEQRLHLARDLHDWLAHEMTGIVLAAQAGQVDDKDPTLTFRQIEEAGVRGLDAMDRALRLLRVAGERPAATATMADVRALVDRFATSSGAEVTCEVEVPEPRPEITATVHRVVVESLTNIRRHAQAATTVQVRVAREGDDVVVEVTDNSPARARRTRRGGSGLAGLRDWVAALDGTLTAGAARPGWRVRAVLPA